MTRDAYVTLSESLGEAVGGAGRSEGSLSSGWHKVRKARCHALGRDLLTPFGEPVGNAAYPVVDTSMLVDDDARPTRLAQCTTTIRFISTKSPASRRYR